MKTFYLSVLLLFIFADYKLFSQAKEEIKKLIGNQVVNSQQKSINTTVENNLINSNSSLNLISLFNETKASVLLGFETPKSTFNIGVSQKLNKTQKAVTFTDLDGITKGTVFQLSWQMPLGIKIPEPIPVLDIRKFIEIKQKFIDKTKLKKMVDEITWDDLDDESKKYAIESGVLNLKAFETSWIVGAKLTSSKLGYDFIKDTLSIKPESATHTNNGFEASVSKFFSLDVYFSIGFSYSKIYESGKESINYLFPQNNGKIYFEKDITFGTPIKKMENRIIFEYRKIFRDKNNGEPRIGINPNFNILTSKEKLNLDIPIYFISKDDKGKFNGLQAGIKAGFLSLWNEFSLKKDNLYFGIFIGKPFTVNP